MSPLVLLAFLQTLLLAGHLDRRTVEAARERLLGSGGELWMDGWADAVRGTATVLSAAAESPQQLRRFVQAHMERVQAGSAALALLPTLLRMYPEVAAELPESLAGLVRLGLLPAPAGAALLARLEIDEGEARFFHGIGVDIDGRAARGVADA